MDPLSVTANIVGLIQITFSLVSYINDLRTTSRDQAKIAVEASNLCSLLTNLRFRIDETQDNTPWFQQVKSLSAPNGPLDQFKGALECVVDKVLPTDKVSSIRHKLTWNLQSKECAELLQRIERLKSHIDLILTQAHFTLSLSTFDKVAEISRDVKDIKLDQDCNLLRDLQQKLGASDPTSNYDAACSKSLAGTGAWLLNDTRFSQWKLGPMSFMWLYGIAGCGKTILSSTIIANLTSDIPEHQSTPVLYFYFSFQDSQKQSISSLLRTILFQLLPQNTHVQRELKAMYEGPQRPNDNQIRSIIDDVFRGMSKGYLVIDALDECAPRSALLSFLKDIHRDHKHIHMCVTSRRERDIEEVLSTIVDHGINMEGPAHDEDIRAYVQYQIEHSSRLKKWPISIKTEIERSLMSKAQGMFQWVSCQIDALEHCLSLDTLRRTLSTLPDSLHETYNRILQSLDSKGYLSDALRVLQWLCFSFRPLHLPEIVDILALSQDGRKGFSAERRVIDPWDVVTICPSLITISVQQVHFHWWSTPTDVYVVSLAHASVREYFFSERCPHNINFTADVAHLRMAEDSLLYLYDAVKFASSWPCIEANHLDVDVVAWKRPLAFYAAEFWWEHRRHTNKKPAPDIIDTAHELIINKDMLLIYLQMFHLDLSCHCRSKCDYYLEDGLDLPLFYAVHTGNLTIIQRLLQKGTDLGIDDVTMRKTAFHAATSTEFLDVILFLLPHGTMEDKKRALDRGVYSRSSSEVRDAIVQSIPHFNNADDGFNFWGDMLSSAADINAIDDLTLALSKILTPAAFPGDEMKEEFWNESTLRTSYSFVNPRAISIVLWAIEVLREALHPTRPKGIWKPTLSRHQSTASRTLKVHTSASTPFGTDVIQRHLTVNDFTYIQEVAYSNWESMIKSRATVQDSEELVRNATMVPVEESGQLL